MRSLLAFTKKEFTEHIRSVRFYILIAVTVFFGITNPIIAKVTPMLLELLSDSLEMSGMEIVQVSATAMDSWVQYFGNLPVCIITFILIESRIFTSEYRSGTLILSLTKGLSRYKVVVSKAFVLAFIWTAVYWLYFLATYIGTLAIFDEHTAVNLAFSAVCYWVFGLFVAMLVVLFSAVGKTNIFVLLGCGGVVFITYILSLLPKIKNYTPMYLTDGYSLVYGVSTPSDYAVPFIITVALTALCIGASVVIFNKKKL